jgi:hypothetical protein
MAALECKVAMVISRLVKFELLLELKIEQKHGTSLVKLVLLRRKSGLLPSVCPSQLYIFDIATESARTSLPDPSQYLATFYTPNIYSNKTVW